MPCGGRSAAPATARGTGSPRGRRRRARCRKEERGFTKKSSLPVDPLQRGARTAGRAGTALVLTEVRDQRPGISCLNIPCRCRDGRAFTAKRRPVATKRTGAADARHVCGDQVSPPGKGPRWIDHAAPRRSKPAGHQIAQDSAGSPPAQDAPVPQKSRQHHTAGFCQGKEQDCPASAICRAGCAAPAARFSPPADATAHSGTTPARYGRTSGAWRHAPACNLA